VAGVRSRSTNSGLHACSSAETGLTRVLVDVELEFDVQLRQQVVAEGNRSASAGRTVCDWRWWAQLGLRLWTMDAGRTAEEGAQQMTSKRACRQATMQKGSDPWGGEDSGRAV